MRQRSAHKGAFLLAQEEVLKKARIVGGSRDERKRREREEVRRLLSEDALAIAKIPNAPTKHPQGCFFVLIFSLLLQFPFIYSIILLCRIKKRGLKYGKTYYYLEV